MANEVSLLVPCFNAERHVDAFIQSIAPFRDQFHEVLFWDDGSTDGTADKLRSVGENVEIGGRNGGASAARNALLETSSGAFVHFHDIDDPFIRPDFLDILVPHIERETVVFGLTEFVELDGKRHRKPAQPDRINNDLATLVLSDVIHLNATIWPRSLLQKIGGFRTELPIVEDIMIFVDAYAEGAKFAFVDEVLAEHVKNPHSLLNSQSAQHADICALEVCRIANRRVPPEISNQVSKKAAFHLRRLVLGGHKTASRKGFDQVKHILTPETWGGGKLERLIARMFGIRASMSYLAWRADRTQAQGET